MTFDEYNEAFQRGYSVAMADICAGLRTGRTALGEAITGAAHAADVIEHGDFNGMAGKPAKQKGEE